jgi:hypothetical protein
MMVGENAVSRHSRFYGGVGDKQSSLKHLNIKKIHFLSIFYIRLLFLLIDIYSCCFYATCNKFVVFFVKRPCNGLGRTLGLQALCNEAQLIAIN